MDTITKTTAYALMSVPPLTATKTTAYVLMAANPPVVPQAEQMAVLGVEDISGAVPQVEQLLMLAVIDGPPFSYSLGPAFKLPCWQPCTAYGTEARVIIFN